MANKPNNPSLWSKAKSLAKSKFDVYPSAYANGWAAKYYKSKGGTWRKGEKGMMMQDGGTSTDIPVRRMKTKTVTVSPSGDYKRIEKQKLTSQGESSSSRTRRTVRGLLKGAPKASKMISKPREESNYEEENLNLNASMKRGGKVSRLKQAYLKSKK